MIDESLKVPEAILLDMDDTILASRQASQECWMYLCNRHAPRINGLTPQKLFTAISGSIQWYWKDPQRNNWGRIHPIQAYRRVVRHAFHHMGIDASEKAHELADAFHMKRSQMIQPFPGAIEALRHFRDTGIQLALITNGSKKMQRLKINKFKLDRFFECVLIEDEFGAGKPDERVFRHVLEQLHVSAQNTWMVGDNLACDVEGPQRLGIFSIWNDFERSGLPDNATVCPDKVIYSLSELTAYVSPH